MKEENKLDSFLMFTSRQYLMIKSIILTKKANDGGEEASSRTDNIDVTLTERKEPVQHEYHNRQKSFCF